MKLSHCAIALVAGAPIAIALASLAPVHAPEGAPESALESAITGALQNPPEAKPKSPQGQDEPERCTKCHSTGKIPCSEHPRSDCEMEEDVLYCSVIADCKVCGGVGWLGCPECKNEIGHEWVTKKLDKIQTRKKALEFMDTAMKRELRKAESKHMVLVWEMEAIKIEKRRIPPHEAMHIYLKRMEAVFADFCARFEITEKVFSEKSQLFVWWLEQDHKDGSMAFCQQSGSGGVKLMGSRPRYSICGNKQHFNDDERLHRNIVHCVAHLLMSNEVPAGWIGNLKAGWADEGLAHWFEDRYWGVCDTYCFQEANTNVDFKGGRWRPAVRKMVAEGDTPNIAEVFEKNTDTLTLPENAVAFSYVDYLITHDGAKFDKLIKKLKAKVPTRDALKEIFGMAPLEFEAVWKAWVLATYPIR